MRVMWYLYSIASHALSCLALISSHFDLSAYIGVPHKPQARSFVLSPNKEWQLIVSVILLSTYTRQSVILAVYEYKVRLPSRSFCNACNPLVSWTLGFY